MKKCPKCNRTYSDATLNFCLDDGIRLENFDDDFETVVKPNKFKLYKIIVPVAALVVLIVLGSMAIGFYQMRDQITPLFDPNPQSSPTSSHPPEVSTEKTEEQEILEILKTVRKAWSEDDLDTLDEIMAEEYYEEDSYGQKITKKQILSPILIGKRISLKHSDVEIDIDDEDATVTGKGVSKAEIGGIQVTYRFSFKTDFEKRGGKWKATYTYLSYQQ